MLEPSRGEGQAYSVLVTESSGYRLAVSETAVDAQRFARLVAAAQSSLEAGEPGAALGSFSAALSLWRGDVLVDLRRFPFVTSWRPGSRNCGSRRRRAASRRTSTSGTTRKPSPRPTGCSRSIRCAKVFAAQRMLALYRVGRQSDALATYRDLRVRLDTELGTEPNRSLQWLEQRILWQDPNLQSEQREPEPPAPPHDLRRRSRRPTSWRVAPGSADAPLPLPDGDGCRVRLALALVAFGLVSLALAGSRPPPELERTVSANSVGSWTPMGTWWARSASARAQLP